MSIEGPLFVVLRSGIPTFRLTVLNRHSDSVFVEDLKDFQYEVTPQNTVLYQNGNSDERGIWFYDEAELRAFVSVVQPLAVPRQKIEAEDRPEAKSTELRSVALSPPLDLLSPGDLSAPEAAPPLSLVQFETELRALVGDRDFVRAVYADYLRRTAPDVR